MFYTIFTQFSYICPMCFQTMVQRMRAAQEALESEAKEEEFYLKAMVAKAKGRPSSPH